jgi:hypothetical protein
MNGVTALLGWSSAVRSRVYGFVERGRLLLKKKKSKARMVIAATPPTTPPAIAATGVLERMDR